MTNNLDNISADLLSLIKEQEVDIVIEKSDSSIELPEKNHSNNCSQNFVLLHYFSNEIPPETGKGLVV